MWIDGDTNIFPREVVDHLPDNQKVLRIVPDGKLGECIVNPFGYKTVYQPAWYSIKIRLDSMRDAGFEKQVVLGNQAQVPQQYGKLEDAAGKQPLDVGQSGGRIRRTDRLWSVDCEWHDGQRSVAQAVA